MNSLTKFLVILLLGSGALVFASGGLEGPPGTPPKGVAVQSDAPGTKLDGEISIEFYNLLTDPSTLVTSAGGRFLLRLRRNNDFQMFYAEAPVPNIADPAQVQDIILTAMTSQVLNRFFNGADLIIKIKSLDEFAPLVTPTTVPTQQSIFILADVVLAVQ